MSGRQPWVLLGLLIVAVAILVVLTQPRGPQASPDHESFSDAADGTSALRLYAQSLGYRPSAMQSDFLLPTRAALVFVFSPLPQQGYSAAQASLLLNWVSQGGVLVYAAESGDPQLDRTLGLQRRPVRVDAAAHPPAPIVNGVQRIQGAIDAQPFQANAGQVPLLRNARGDILAVTSSVGRGRVVALADPLVLCNAYLGQADNGRFAADLLALAPPQGSVVFDEYHHAIGGTGGAVRTWVVTPWGAAVLWAVLILIAGLGLRGRAFGPRLSLDRRGERSSGEYAAAVGGMLRRSGARTLTLQVLDAATRRLIGEQVGVSGDASSATYLEVLARRAPALGEALRGAEQVIPEAEQSDAVFLSVAHRLHELAFPSASAHRDAAS